MFRWDLIYREGIKSLIKFTETHEKDAKSADISLDDQDFYKYDGKEQEVRFTELEKVLKPREPKGPKGGSGVELLYPDPPDGVRSNVTQALNPGGAALAYQTTPSVKGVRAQNQDPMVDGAKEGGAKEPGKKDSSPKKKKSSKKRSSKKRSSGKRRGEAFFLHRLIFFYVPHRGSPMKTYLSYLLCCVCSVKGSKKRRSSSKKRSSGKRRSSGKKEFLVFPRFSFALFVTPFDFRDRSEIEDQLKILNACCICI